MKKQIITFGTVLLFVVAGFAAAAQDDAIDPQVAARLAARRAAEAAGTDAAPATPADTAAAAPAATVATTDTGATTAARTDPDEIRRKAALAAAEKEAMVAAVNLPASQVSFKIITDRNIFDPRRAPGSRTLPPINQPPPIRVEQFYLGGTSLKVGKGGWVAFFDGDGVPSYPPTRSVGDMVNEFKIVEISKDEVKLVNTRLTNSEPVVLEALKGLKRNDNEPWTLAYNTQNYGTQIARQAPDTMGAQPPFPSPVIQQVQFMGDDGSANPYGGYQDDGTGANQGRRRGRGNGGNPGGGGGPGGRTRGGRGGGGGGFGATDTGGGFGGGGFGGGGGANTQFAPPVTVDPNAPVDPAVLARLAARRAAEQ